MRTRHSHTRAAVRPSPLPQLRRLLGPLVAIVLATAAVIAITVALASSPAGATLTTAMAPAVAKPGGARPAAPATADQSSQAAQSSQADPSAAAPAAAPARPQTGAPGGRNVPSLQRGWPDVLKYGGLMAGTTLVVVLVLRARRPRPRLGPTPSRRVPVA